MRTRDQRLPPPRLVVSRSASDLALVLSSLSIALPVVSSTAFLPVSASSSSPRTPIRLVYGLAHSLSRTLAGFS
eukprot:5849925-Pleurochrysis_carterae.AAC.2